MLVLNTRPSYSPMLPRPPVSKRLDPYITPGRSAETIRLSCVLYESIETSTSPYQIAVWPFVVLVRAHAANLPRRPPPPPFNLDLLRTLTSS